MSSQEDQGVYHEKVRKMVSEGQSRLIVNINDLRRRNEKRAKESVTLPRFCKNRKDVTLLVGFLQIHTFCSLTAYDSVLVHFSSSVG